MAGGIGCNSYAPMSIRAAHPIAVEYSRERRAPLIEFERRREVRISRVNCRATSEQGMSLGGPAVVGQRAKHWIDVQQVAGSRGRGDS